MHHKELSPFLGGRYVKILTIIEIALVATVLGLFAWTFEKEKYTDEDVFNYARYMIYLLVAEVRHCMSCFRWFNRLNTFLLLTKRDVDR